MTNLISNMIPGVMASSGGDTHIAGDGFVYFGGDPAAPVEGDWRQGIISNELVLQEYESGVWVSAEHNFTTINIANYTLQPGDHYIHVIHTSTAEVTILVATNQVKRGRTFTVKDASGNANFYNIILDCQGSETIDGAATLVMNVDYESVTLYCDGVNWFVV